MHPIHPRQHMCFGDRAATQQVERIRDQKFSIRYKNAVHLLTLQFYLYLRIHIHIYIHIYIYIVIIIIITLIFIKSLICIFIN